MRELDVAWLAGFWEGEGWINFVHSKAMKFPQLRISLTQNQREPLDKVKEMYGFGGVFADKYNKCFRYITTTSKAAQIAREILPYIVNPYKRGQIISALEKHDQYQKEIKDRKANCDITGKGGTCGS